MFILEARLRRNLPFCFTSLKHCITVERLWPRMLHGICHEMIISLSRAEGKVKHCRIIQEGRLFTIGTAQFESLVELVDYYTKWPLYRKIKLKYPINEKVNVRFSSIDERFLFSTNF